MEQQDKECHNRQKLRREERIGPQNHQRERGPVDAEISDSQPPKPRIRATRFVVLAIAVLRQDHICIQGKKDGGR